MKHLIPHRSAFALTSVLLVALAACQGLPPAPPPRQPPAQVAHLTDEVRQQLDAEIDRQMQTNNLPSVEASIIVPGEPPYTFVQGKANLDTGRERTPDEHIRIASNTKTFIDTAILQLVDQGKTRTSGCSANCAGTPGRSTASRPTCSTCPTWTRR